jgi:hypothetical protein
MTTALDVMGTYPEVMNYPLITRVEVSYSDPEALTRWAEPLDIAAHYAQRECPHEYPFQTWAIRLLYIPSIDAVEILVFPSGPNAHYEHIATWFQSAIFVRRRCYGCDRAGGGYAWVVDKGLAYCPQCQIAADQEAQTLYSRAKETRHRRGR